MSETLPTALPKSYLYEKGAWRNFLHAVLCDTAHRKINCHQPSASISNMSATNNLNPPATIRHQQSAIVSHQPPATQQLSTPKQPCCAHQLPVEPGRLLQLVERVLVEQGEAARRRLEGLPVPALLHLPLVHLEAQLVPAGGQVRWPGAR